MIDEKILLVDDDKRLLAAMERVFRKRYKVDTALCGDIALTHLRDHGPYAVVICDMMMPRMNGLEFIDKAKDISSESVYMMLSGNASLETAVDALNRGLIFKFFSKPASQEELVQGIEQAIQEHHLNTAKQQFLSLSSTSVSSRKIEEKVTSKIEEATQAIQNDAARALVDVQENSMLSMHPLMIKPGKKSYYILASFDADSTARINNIKNVLGSSPEVIAKIDILMLGKIASHICDNIQEIGVKKFVIDLHFSTLYHRRYLDMYLRICRSLIEAVRNSISIKITGISDDILPSRLTDLIGRIRPFSHSVFVELSDLENSNTFAQGLSNTVLAVDYNSLCSENITPTSARRLFSTLTHSSNKVFLQNCDETREQDLSRLMRVDYFLPAPPA